MKNLTYLIGLASMFAEMGQSPIDIIDRERPDETQNPERTKTRREPTRFADEFGVKNNLRDFKKIVSGESKKQPRKQSRIVAKVNAWIKAGSVTLKDIENV